jgi:hypothetical protein
MKVALSIDTDFFTRENPMWDFSHNETALYMNDMLWDIRYSQINLHKETSLRYVDLRPELLFETLIRKGFTFLKTKVGSGWSHKDAYRFFRKYDFDFVVNIDAHHDCGYHNFEEVACDNWIHFLKKAKPSLSGVWIYPKWLSDKDINGNPIEGFINQPFNNINKFAGEVVVVYIAQSPAWVPPHHDNIYKELNNQVLRFAGKNFFDYDGGIVVRKKRNRSRDIKSFEAHQKVLEKFCSNTVSILGGKI